jgi:hypothetical protein
LHETTAAAAAIVGEHAPERTPVSGASCNQNKAFFSEEKKQKTFIC